MNTNTPTITFTRHRVDGGTEPLLNPHLRPIELPANTPQDRIDRLAERELRDAETLRIVAHLGERRLCYQ
jgi:hypothetical protein